MRGHRTSSAQAGLTRRSFNSLVGSAILSPAVARVSFAQEVFRVGLATRSLSTILLEAAVSQKLFEKEGIAAEVTSYRSGAESFEATAAGAADVNFNSPAMVAAAQRKGVVQKVVAAGSPGAAGWYLGVVADSPIKTVSDLEGKKVGVTSLGSATDALALWTMQAKKVSFTRVPLGGGLVANLLARNVDAAVLYTPLSLKLIVPKQARGLLDFFAETPRHMQLGWIAGEKAIKERPAVLQKGLNAIFGGINYLKANRDASIKLIMKMEETTAEVAAAVHDRTIVPLSSDGVIDPRTVQAALDLARLAGMADMAPADQAFTTQFKVIPTR